MATIRTETATKTDTTHSIFRSAAAFFSGTMLSRITGMLRDMSMAYAFGTTSAIAALLIAFRFAHLLRRLLGEGAMQTALVPHFEEIRLENKARAGFFFRDLTASVGLTLIILTLVIMGLLQTALISGILDEGNEEIAHLTFLMMPSLLFICLFGINLSLLQCEKNYFYSSAAPIAFNLIWILGVMCTSHLDPVDAMLPLSFFIVLACFGQWAITLPNTLLTLKKLGIERLLKGIKLFSKDVKGLMRPLALGILGVAAFQINNAMDAVFARWADEEGPAFLWYAIRLQQLPLALFGVALSSALLPPLARAMKAKDQQQSEKFLHFAFLRTAELMLPITFGLFLLGDGCVNLVYGYGNFTAHSVAGTTLCLWGYTLGLLPMALILMLAPAFYAAGNYKIPAITSTGSMAINLALNAVLVGIFNYGAVSVAISTSISAWINVIWLGIFLHKLQIDNFWTSKSLWISTAKIFTGTIFASLITLCLEFILWGEPLALQILPGSGINNELSTLLQIVRLVIEGLPFLGLLVYSLIPQVREREKDLKDLKDLRTLGP